MKKGKGPELKNKQKLKRIAIESKAIVKNKSKVKDIVKDVFNSGKAPALAVVTSPADKGKKKKSRKNKNVNAISESKVEEKRENGKTAEELNRPNSDKEDKKQVKKLKQKLKKQQKKAGLKEEGTVKQDIGKNAKEEDTLNKNKNKETKASGLKAKKQKKGKDGKAKREPMPKNPAQEAATIFVGNLPVNTKRVQLLRLFQIYGSVIAVRLRTAAGKAIFKHKQRKDAGTLNAYVVFQQEEHAKKSLALNGNDFKGNHLRVTAADSKTRDDGDVKRTVFVGSLKYTATEEKLRDIFSSCGEIEYIRCLQEAGKGCKGVAYVCFKAPEAVSLALELNETVLDERPIHVERYSVKKLGAKQTREAEAIASVKKPKVGAQQRLAEKGKNKGAPTNAKAGNNDKNRDEFRGVKVDAANGGIAKKKNKKKVSSEMHKLAKKIAPKSK